MRDGRKYSNETPLRVLHRLVHLAVSDVSPNFLQSYVLEASQEESDEAARRAEAKKRKPH